MDGLQIFGLIAGIVTSGAMMPQLIKTWKTKEVSSLSLPMFGVYIVGFSMWITYGFLKSDLPIVLTNFISIGTTIILIIFKIKYKDKDKKPDE